MGRMGAVMSKSTCFLGVDMRYFMCIINTNTLKELGDLFFKYWILPWGPSKKIKN